MTDVTNLLSFCPFGGDADDLINNDNCLKAMFIGSIIVLVALTCYACVECIFGVKKEIKEDRESSTSSQNDEESALTRAYIVEI